MQTSCLVWVAKCLPKKSYNKIRQNWHQQKSKQKGNTQAIEWNKIDRQALELKAYRGWTRAMLMTTADKKMEKAEKEWETVHEQEQ